MEEQIKQKLEELKKSKEQQIASLNATLGAIQALEDLLKKETEQKTE